MPLNVGGYNLSNASGALAFGATGTRVNAASYGIRDPMLPGMLGSVTDGSSTYKCYPWPVNDTNLNIGSPWSAGRFTAPVAGIYYISFSGIVGLGTVSAGAGYFALIVNGVNYYWSYKDTVNTWELHHQEILFKLSAGDTVAWAMNITPGPDSGNAAGAYRTNHNTCTIWLVG